MFSLPPHLLKLYSYFVECLGDDGDEHVLDHPGQKEDHRDKVEGGLPGIKTVSCSVHDINPSFLWCCLGMVKEKLTRTFMKLQSSEKINHLSTNLVNSKNTCSKLPKPRESNIKSASVRKIHTSEALTTFETIWVFWVSLSQRWVRSQYLFGFGWSLNIIVIWVLVLEKITCEWNINAIRHLIYLWPCCCNMCQGWSSH